MLTIETQSQGDSTTLRLQGDLVDDAVAQLERCWRKSSCCDQLHLDLCEVVEIDDAGKTLVSRMFAEGVELVVRSRPKA